MVKNVIKGHKIFVYLEFFKWSLQYVLYGRIRQRENTKSLNEFQYASYID